MPDHQAAHDTLRQCVKDAHHDKAQIDACQAQFTATPDTSVEDGKVFASTDGKATFVTPDGKVFAGKVFH